MINLLVSYPRSGNTWVRFILASYFHPDANLILKNNGFGRLTDLDHDVVQTFPHIPPLDICFLKSHMRITSDGYDLFKYKQSPDAVLKCQSVIADHHILLVRNPLDVITSHVNFEHFIYDKKIDNLSSFTEKHIQTGSEHESFRWAEYHENWLEHGKPSVIIRYEDMLVDPLQQMRRMFDAIGISMDQSKMQTAIDRCTFDKLKAMENWERKDITFFKHGKAHAYKEVLSRDHIRRVVKNMGKTMEKFGYSGDYLDWV
jgi:aryl sulfotransferase